MPKKETRHTDDGRHVLKPGEYWREDRQTYQYKQWDPHTKRFVTCSAKTLTALREKEKKVQKDILDGISSVKGKDLLDEYYDLWRQNKRIKANVLSNYCYMYDRFVRPALGRKKVKDIKYTTVQTFYLDLLDGGRMAINTLEVVHNVLHQILEQAVRDDVIRRNPSDGILPDLKQRYPRSKKRKALTREEQDRFVEVLGLPENAAWRPAFMVLLYTGLRVGELAGLTWDDVDEAAGLLHVRRTMVYYDDRSGKVNACRLAINSTKTVTSMRDLPLTDELRGLFREQREIGVPCRQTVDGVSDFVFTNRFGDCHHQSTLNKGLKRIIRQANADPDALALPAFSCHHLRHTFCTNMVVAGVELTAASALMGHRDIQTTANIYNDVQQAQKEKAMRQLSEYSGSSRGNGEKDG